MNGNDIDTNGGGSLTPGDVVDMSNIAIGQGLGNTSTSSDDPIGYISDDGDTEMYKLWGHRLAVFDDNVACVSCGEAQEIPEVFRKSTGFREAAYKMMIFAHFKHKGCDHSLEQERRKEQLKKQREMQKKKRKKFKQHGPHFYQPTTLTGTKTDMYLPTGHMYQIGDTRYTYEGNDTWVDTAGNRIDTQRLIAEHKQDALDALPQPLFDKLAANAKSQLQNDSIQSMDHTNKSSGTATDSLKKSDAAQSTAEKSIRQKFAEKLLDRK